MRSGYFGRRPLLRTKNEQQQNVEKSAVGHKGPQSHDSDQSYHPLANNPNFEVLIIVTTMGELGNHLQLLPVGYDLRYHLTTRHGIDSNVAFFHYKVQSNDKGQETHAKLTRCFKGLHDLQYLSPLGHGIDHKQEAGHHMASTSVITVPQALRTGSAKYRVSTRRQHEHIVIKTASAELLEKQMIEISTALDSLHASLESEHDEALLVYHISLSQNPMQPTPETVKRDFAFDYEACPCDAGVISDTDTVLHMRGFSTEFQVREKKEDHRFEELDPERVADNLLGHLSRDNHDTVAIMSRYAQAANPFLSILEKRGIPSRVLQSGSDMEDFCLLSKASRVAGHTQSTFFTWAALHLNNNLQRADAYQLRGKLQFISRDQNQTCRGFGNNHTIFCHVFEPKFPEDKHDVLIDDGAGSVR